VGNCFQIKDDIFDSGKGDIGKTTGNDLREERSPFRSYTPSAIRRKGSAVIFCRMYAVKIKRQPKFRN